MARAKRVSANRGSALWFHKQSSWVGPSSFSTTVATSYSLAVDTAGTSTVQVVDMMGNSVATPYANGHITLSLTESSIYIVSANATVATAGVTLPVGYIGQ
ncbi:hypothetical protein RI103_33425 [Paraburkholderia sp. FT54]|uniref:hypothetical protein n=1 Tax=Paraburkholderia sp. FT54 TaxID=3074437 RepID=UPI002877E452|nr:hypothetical protein [Paraburkholderia sp. FT54]WNC94830.1 hypothetical protein RI103_33425 [Paraburkholderia sp. FT54]